MQDAGRGSYFLLLQAPLHNIINNNLPKFSASLITKFECKLDAEKFKVCLLANPPSSLAAIDA